MSTMVMVHVISGMTIITMLIMTTIDEILNGVIVLSLAKKKFANIFKIAKAGIPYPKYFSASDVCSISFTVKEP